MDSRLKNIFQLIKDRTNSLEKRDKIILLTAIALFITSKITSLFKLNIPGLNVLPTALILTFIGLNIIQQNKDKKNENLKNKMYYILGSILISFSILIFGCIGIVYPFVILSAIFL